MSFLHLLGQGGVKKVVAERLAGVHYNQITGQFSLTLGRSGVNTGITVEQWWSEK